MILLLKGEGRNNDGYRPLTAMSPKQNLNKELLDSLSAVDPAQSFNSKKIFQVSYHNPALEGCRKAYENAKSKFDQAEINLQNHIYQHYDYSKNDPLIFSSEILEAISEATQGLRGMYEQMRNFAKGEVIHQRINEQLKEDFRYFSWLIEDWVNSLDRFIPKELSLLESFKGKDEKELIEPQINAIDQELKKIKGKVKAILPSLARFKQKEKEENLAAAIIDSLERIEKISGVKRKKIGALQIDYGSPAWHELAKQRPKEEKNLLKRMWQNLTHPESWSDQTKKHVSFFFTAMQFSKAAIAFSSTLNQGPIRLPPRDFDISKEELNQIDKEAALLQNLLAFKFYLIKNNPQLLEKFTKRVPESTRQAFQRILENNFKKPSIEEISGISQSFRREQIAQRSNLKAESSFFNFKDWWFPSSEEVVKEDTSGDFLRDPLLVLSPELSTNRHVELKKGIKLFERIILKGFSKPSEITPVPSLLEEITPVAQVCYSIRHLENNIQTLMLSLRREILVDPRLLEKYGRKHVNNLQQEKLISALALADIEVPAIKGIGSGIILQFLQQISPVIFDHWTALGELSEQHEEESLFLEKESVKNHLEAINQAIFESFNAEDAFERLALPVEVIAWLEENQKLKNYLMVRSTGAEDSSQVTNAGGNTSVAYVSPDGKSICKALGKVVSSYFGAASLQNRLNAHQNTFRQPLQLAVDLQTLIGETIGGGKNESEIPISVVIFTDEPLYTNGEKFRIMRCSAIYGHGEGVVGNRGIATDTALLLVSDAHPDKIYLLYDNQSKPERLAPIETSNGVLLEKVSNPPELKNRPVLKPELLARLFYWGVIGEKFFGEKPADMEIVIKNNKIYPVQIREVVRPLLYPTFLDIEKVESASLSPIKSSLHLEMLIPGQGSVFCIDRKEEILVAYNLEMAEKAFQEGRHRLIIVHQPEPANSHPVVNFSALGMPCLIGKPNEVERLLAEVGSQFSLVVCMQTSSLHLWETQKGGWKTFITEGFAAHPASILISLPLNDPVKIAPITQKIPFQIKQKLDQIKYLINPLEVLNALNELEQYPEIKNLKEQIRFLERQIEGKKSSKEFQVALKTIQVFSDQLHAVLAEIREVLGLPKNGRRLKFLFWVKTLEALLIGKAEKRGSLYQYSLMDIYSVIQRAQELLNYSAQLSHPPHLIDLLGLGDQSFTKKAKDEWLAFLLYLEGQIEGQNHSLEKIKLFKTNLYALERTGIFPQWITFFFAKDFTDKDKFLDLFPTNDLSFVQEELIKREELVHLENRIDLFLDPETFDSVWQQLLYYKDAYTQVSFMARFKTATPLVQMSILRNIHTLVEIFDKSIKAVKISPKRDNDQKVLLFKEMLKPYFSLLKSFYSGLIDEGTIAIHKSWPLSKYLAEMESILENLPINSPDQLRPSIDFSVSGALIGALTDFSRHYPKRLEDFFTLTHQVILFGITTIHKGLFSDDQIEYSFLPDNLKAAIHLINIKYPMRTGFDIALEKISIKYNIPLQNHSASLILTYNPPEDSIALKTQFLGRAGRRWPFINNLLIDLEALDFLPKIQLSYYHKRELSIDWLIHDLHQLEYVLEIFECVCDFSLDEAKEGLFFRNLITILKAHNNKLETITKILAIISLKNSEEESPRLYLKVIESWVANGLDQEVFVALAEQGITAEEASKRRESLFLYRLLLESLSDHTGMGEIVKIGINDPDLNVRREAFFLLKVLIEKHEKNLSFLKIAQEASNDPDLEIRRDALRIIKCFLDDQKGDEEALLIAERLLTSDKVEEKEEAFWLIANLVRHGYPQAFLIARRAVEKGLNEVDKKIKGKVAFLVEELIKQKKISHLATLEMNNFLEGMDVKKRLLNLFISEK